MILTTAFILSIVYSARAFATWPSCPPCNYPCVTSKVVRTTPSFQCSECICPPQGLGHLFISPPSSRPISSNPVVGRPIALQPEANLNGFMMPRPKFNVPQRPATSIEHRLLDPNWKFRFANQHPNPPSAAVLPPAPINYLERSKAIWRRPVQQRQMKPDPRIGEVILTPPISHSIEKAAFPSKFRSNPAVMPPAPPSKFNIIGNGPIPHCPPCDDWACKRVIDTTNSGSPCGVCECPSFADLPPRPETLASFNSGDVSNEMALTTDDSIGQLTTDSELIGHFENCPITEPCPGDCSVGIDENGCEICGCPKGRSMGKVNVFDAGLVKFVKPEHDF